MGELARPDVAGYWVNAPGDDCRGHPAGVRVNSGLGVHCRIVPRGVLNVLGIDDRAATRLEVEPILRCVDKTPTLRLGTVRARFQEIASPLPVADLLDEIFSSHSPSDRVGAMMGYFIDVQPLGGP